MKCRSGFAASRDSYGEIPEDGAMTGLTVTDSETGKSVTLSLSTLETETGRRLFKYKKNDPVNLMVKFNNKIWI